MTKTNNSRASILTQVRFSRVLLRSWRTAASRTITYLGTLSALLLPSRAAANVASQLDYFRERGAAHCPDEAKLRRAVEARLGYDPFIEWSPRRVVAEIVTNGTQLSAIIRLIEGGGIVQSRSELSASEDDCEELVAAVALTIAIHLDPENAMRLKHEEPAEASEPQSKNSTPSASAVPPVASSGTADSGSASTPASSTARRARAKNAADPHAAATARTVPAGQAVPAVRIGGALLQGLEPHSTWGLRAGASLGKANVFAVAELFFGLPESERYAAGAIRSYVMSAAISPCARYRWLAGCGVAMLDLVRAHGEDVPAPASASLVQVALGARVETQLELSRTWAAVLGVDLLRNITSTSLRLAQTERWKSPQYRYGVGLAVELRFR